jgi:signal transduction histidine kinase
MISRATMLLSKTQLVSHEFVNSLASVRSLSELLLDYPGLNTCDRTQCLNIIREETERLIRLMEQLNLASNTGGSL